MFSKAEQFLEYLRLEKELFEAFARQGMAIIIFNICDIKRIKHRSASSFS